MGSWISGAGPASLVLAGLLSSVVACGSDDSGVRSEASSGGSAGSGAEIMPDQLAFEAPEMTMTPGETRAITVHIRPAGEYRVRFALLGDTDDASLDRSEIVSDPDGAATVLLTAPSGPSETTFTIRASIGQAIATEAEVTIASQGTAALAVKPVYSGERVVRGWFASAHPGVSCAELPSNPPPDSDLKVETTLNFVPTLEVPAGRDLAVTVRGDYQVAGCLDVPPLAVNEARTVEVDASDLPVQLEGVALGVRLDLSGPVPSWEALAAVAVEQFETALLGDSYNDVDALLDAMTAVAAARDIDTNLDDARNNGGWEGALGSQFGNDAAPTVIRDRIREWYGVAATQLGESAWLEASLEPVVDVRDQADLRPLTFADLPADDMGFPPEVRVTWLAEPNDKVLLGASFSWTPWPAFTKLAELEASRAAVAELELPAALIAHVDCDATATNLYDRALDYMGSCGLNCLTSVCEDAVTHLWTRANDAVATNTAWLDLSVAAAATVDDHARITGFAGEWVGTLDTGDQVAQASGEVEGWALEDDSATQ